MSREPKGKIVFVGNPWPLGFEVLRFDWTAVLEPRTGIWFDFHLESAGSPVDPNTNTDEGTTWDTVGFWCSIPSCTISSTHWNSDRGVNHTGVLVATRDRPLSLRSLLIFKGDESPGDPEWHFGQFGLLLHGCEALAHHHWTIFPNRGGKTWSVRWWGKIALTYDCSTDFDFAFRARIPKAVFGGLKLPQGVAVTSAIEYARPWLAEPDRFSQVRRKDGVWLIAK